MCLRLLVLFIYDESGQGISEYGSILAWVALMVALGFSTHAAYRNAVINAFVCMGNMINGLVNQAMNPT